MRITDFAAEALHDANEVRFTTAGGHEVDNPHVTGGRMKIRLENQGIRTVSSLSGARFC